MSEFPESPELAVPADPDGERPARPETPPPDARAARLAKFKREQLIVDYLNRGVSVAEIAAEFGVGEKRMRAIIREVLARRQPHPPEEFVAIQVSRLNEALLVAFSAMTGMNLKAVDRVVRIVRELDRYHGLFPAARRRLPEPDHIEAPAEAPLAFGGALFCRAEFQPQGMEEFMLPTGRHTPPTLDRPPVDRPEIPRQDLEKIESAPGTYSTSPDFPSEVTVPTPGPGSARARCVAPQPEDLPRDGAAPDDHQGPPGSAPMTMSSSRAKRGDPEGRRALCPLLDRHAASRLAMTPQTPTQAEPILARAAVADRPGFPPQDPEKVESAPGCEGRPRPAPATLSPAAARFVNVRTTLNGAAAC